jgi:hypothetical protein
MDLGLGGETRKEVKQANSRQTFALSTVLTCSVTMNGYL